MQTHVCMLLSVFGSYKFFKWVGGGGWGGIFNVLILGKISKTIWGVGGGGAHSYFRVFLISVIDCISEWGHIFYIWQGLTILIKDNSDFD